MFHTGLQADYSKFWGADRLAVDPRQVRDIYADRDMVLKLLLPDHLHCEDPRETSPPNPPPDLAQRPTPGDMWPSAGAGGFTTGLDVAIISFIHFAHAAYLAAPAYSRRLSIVAQPPFFPSHVPDYTSSLSKQSETPGIKIQSQIAVLDTPRSESRGLV